MENEQKHHPIGMSTWPALLRCNAFKAAQLEEGEFARRGKAVHELVASMLRMTHGGNAQARRPADMAREDCDTAAWFAQWAVDQGLPWEVERRVEFPRDCAPPLDGVFGTADLICYDAANGVVHVADFKTFSRADESFDSFPQLMGYALAFAMKNELDKTHGVMVEMTLLHGGVRYAETRRVTLEYCAETARRVAEAVLAAERVCEVGKQCDWCAHNGCCNGCREAVTAAVVDTKSPLCIIGLTQEVLSADEEFAAEVMVMADFVVKQGERVKDMVKVAADANGGVVESVRNNIKWGFRDVAGRRTCHNAAELFAGAMEPYGVTPEKFMALCKPSHSECLAMLREHLGPQFTVKESEAMLDMYFDRGAGTRQFRRF